MQGHAHMEPMMHRALLLAALVGLAVPAARAADCDPSFAVGLPQAVNKAAVGGDISLSGNSASAMGSI